MMLADQDLTNNLSMETIGNEEGRNNHDDEENDNVVDLDEIVGPFPQQPFSVTGWASKGRVVG